MDSAAVEALFPDLPDLDEVGGDQDALDNVETARDKVKYAFDLSSGEGWDEEKLTDEAKLWSKMTEGSSLKIYKRTMEVEASLSNAVTWFKNIENLKKVNETVSEAKTLETITDDCWYTYSEYMGNFLVSNRDVSAFHHRMSLTDGSVIIVSFSCEHPDSPTKEGVVRSDVEVYCYHFSEVSPTKTLITHIGRSDVKGSIPTTFVNWLSTLQHDEFVNMQKEIK